MGMSGVKTPLTLAERRKAWLKHLVAKRSTSWRFAVLPPALDGKTRLQTRREIIHLQDGVCVTWTAVGTDPVNAVTVVGTRLVGWVTRDDRFLEEPLEGARALFWRAVDRDGDGGDQRVVLALTASMESLTTVMPLTALTGSRAAISQTSTSATLRSLELHTSSPRRRLDSASQEVTRHERHVVTIQ